MTDNLFEAQGIHRQLFWQAISELTPAGKDRLDSINDRTSSYNRLIRGLRVDLFEPLRTQLHAALVGRLAEHIQLEESDGTSANI